MLVRTAACALLVIAATAPQAVAQKLADSPFFDRNPPDSHPQGPNTLGRLGYLHSDQQRVVKETMPRIEKAVAAHLANPDTARFRDLRAGRYQKVMVVCGVVDSIAASGETEKRRFIARPTIATLETPENSQAFRAGWKSTGCGF